MFIHDPQTTSNTNETFLHDSLEIRLKNVSEFAYNLKKMLPWYFMSVVSSTHHAYRCVTYIQRVY